ncbi:hypothetical protein C5167_030905 [Papaver somniferum]|nr:hypothetical protein C5167_030905 [Papaver somniferum]
MTFTYTFHHATVKAAANATVEIWVATSIHEFEGKKLIRVKKVNGNGRDE